MERQAGIESMKKSSFAAMILETIGDLLFAIGMCMALILEWNAFNPGVIMGVAGITVLLCLIPFIMNLFAKIS